MKLQQNQLAVNICLNHGLNRLNERMKEGRIQYAPTRPQYNDRRGVLHTPTVDKRNHS